MKKYLLIIILTVLLPFEIFAFSIFGSSVKIPVQQTYILNSVELANKALPDAKNANIDKNLLVMNIDTQAINTNAMHDYTLFGSTAYGPILNIDTNKFIFYITYYLKNERIKRTYIKTIKYEQNIHKNDPINADEYTRLTNKALLNIFKQLKPWLINVMVTQEQNAKERLIHKANDKSNNTTKNTTPNN